jgi:hypothetical protein
MLTKRTTVTRGRHSQLMTGSVPYLNQVLQLAARNLSCSSLMKLTGRLVVVTMYVISFALFEYSGLVRSQVVSSRN